jgi:hypothetical protein
MSQAIQIETAKDQLAKIVELFSSTSFPECIAKVAVNAPEKPCSKWSFGNQLLTMMAGTEDARGFRQWQEVGRHVIPGHHAFRILVPVTVKKTWCPGCGRYVKPKDDKGHADQHESSVYPAFKDAPVFRYEDTEGAELPVYHPKEVPPLMDIAQKWGVEIKYDNLFSVHGFYDRGANKIVLGTEEWSVWFHEFAHKVDHTNHTSEEVGSSTNEIVADLVAAVLARLYGRPDDAFLWQHANLITHSGSNPEKVGRACLGVLKRAERVLRSIVEAQVTKLAPVDNIVTARGMMKTSSMKYATIAFILMLSLVPVTHATSLSSTSKTSLNIVSVTKSGALNTIVVAVNGTTYTAVFRNQTTSAVLVSFTKKTTLGQIAPAMVPICPIPTVAGIQPACGGGSGGLPNQFLIEQLPVGTIYPWPFPNYQNPTSLYIYLNAATGENVGVAVALIAAFLAGFGGPPGIVIAAFMAVDYGAIWNASNQGGTLGMWISVDPTNLFWMTFFHEWYMAMFNHIWLLCGLGCWNVGVWP